MNYRCMYRYFNTEHPSSLFFYGRTYYYDNFKKPLKKTQLDQFFSGIKITFASICNIMIVGTIFLIFDMVHTIFIRTHHGR